MGLGGLRGGSLGIRSLILLQVDPLPDLPPSASAGARLASFAKSVALVATPGDNPLRWKSDVSDSQTHTKSAEITSHPVENGFRITDHVRKLPKVLDFIGIISDTPVGFVDSLLATFSIKSRALEAKSKLDDWFETGEPLFAATSLGVYPSMILRDYSITRNSESGQAIEFSLTLEEILIGSDTLARALIDDDAIFLGAGPGVNGGTLPATPI